MATLNQDVAPKLLELLHTALPNATSVAALFNPANPSTQEYVNSLRVLGPPLGIAVKGFALNTPDQLDSVFGAIVEQRAEALLIMPDAATLDLGVRIENLAAQHRIPIVSTDSDLTSIGGLVSYGYSRRGSFRRYNLLHLLMAAGGTSRRFAAMQNLVARGHSGHRASRNNQARS